MSQVFRREKIHELEFRNATYCYKSSLEPLGPITFRIQSGACYWIRGGSGSGKSTLLRAIAGTFEPQSGDYLVNGKTISDYSFEEFLGIRLNIGFGFSRGGLLNNRSLKENLMLPILYHAKMPYSDAKDYCEKLLQDMGISKYMDMRPATVPGSAAKLAGLLRAFVLEPQVLILDDPTAFVGIDASLELSNYTEKFIQQNPDCTVFVVSDDDQFLPTIQKHEIHILDGQVSLIKRFEPPTRVAS